MCEKVKWISCGHAVVAQRRHAELKKTNKNNTLEIHRNFATSDLADGLGGHRTPADEADSLHLNSDLLHFAPPHLFQFDVKVVIILAVSIVAFHSDLDVRLVQFVLQVGHLFHKPV